MQIDPRTGSANPNYSIPDFDIPPDKVGHAVGSCFAFRKENWKKIINEDGSIGFWVDLVSFCEEQLFGIELAKRGLVSYQLPYPAIEHWGSVTFSANKELAVREISSYLPKDEFIKYLEILQENGQIYGIPIEEEKKLAEEGLAYRMSYSRAMLCKKFGIMDSLMDEELSKRWNTTDRGGNYARALHEKYVNTLPVKKVKWLSKELNKCEKEIG